MQLCSTHTEAQHYTKKLKSDEELIESRQHTNCYLRHLPSNKKKAIPLQAWTDPKGSRRLRLPDFKTIGT
jgi:hypothetical protein